VARRSRTVLIAVIVVCANAAMIDQHVVERTTCMPFRRCDMHAVPPLLTTL